MSSELIYSLRHVTITLRILPRPTPELENPFCMCSKHPLAGRAKGLWSPLQQTQLCNQSDSIMQINSSIFYSPFGSHHSALSWSLVSTQITGIMPCLWKSQRMGEEVLKDLLNHISYSPISTLGTKHKFGIIITSAQVPNTQQRRQNGPGICAACSNVKFKC